MERSALPDRISFLKTNIYILIGFTKCISETRVKPDLHVGRVRQENTFSRILVGVHDPRGAWETKVSDPSHSKPGGLSSKYMQGHLAASADISDHCNLGEGARAYWHLGCCSLSSMQETASTINSNTSEERPCSNPNKLFSVEAGSWFSDQGLNLCP